MTGKRLPGSGHTARAKLDDMPSRQPVLVVQIRIMGGGERRHKIGGCSRVIPQSRADNLLDSAAVKIDAGAETHVDNS